MSWVYRVGDEVVLRVPFREGSRPPQPEIVMPGGRVAVRSGVPE